ncbi:DUF5672 family protein [Mucilaginibacter sp. 22184]|uniref:DUF5672 family protein n=1 Tax=Mucilaginibacter sp. 22184 TaxID=3453887 RepID=UPI003F85EC92
MSALKKVAIIVPFYQNTISDLEKIALTQLQNVLANYPRIIIKPHSFVLPDVVNQYNFTAIETFDDSYFKSIDGYNALMLSDTFYKRFLDYEFILIHQLDAFVFKDELAYWCSQSIDYIGAPWIPPGDYPDFIKAIKSKIQFHYHARFNIQKNGLPSSMQYEYRVGNGGFSLRRVKKFYDLSISMRDRMSVYLTRSEHEFHEDIFWSVEVNRKRKILNIPSYKTGLKFSFELAPERALRLNKNQLPFGCHAWDKNLDFWRQIFKKLGYHI